jgi:hypothetical protein
MSAFARGAAGYLCASGKLRKINATRKSNNVVLLMSRLEHGHEMRVAPNCITERRRAAPKISYKRGRLNKDTQS